MEHTWNITSLEYNINDSDKVIIKAYWELYSIQGEAEAYQTGLVDFIGDVNDPNFIPYDDLTNDIVKGWIFAKEMESGQTDQMGNPIMELEVDQPAIIQQNVDKVNTIIAELLAIENAKTVEVGLPLNFYGYVDQNANDIS
ncbi:MAG: hypothetical protein GY936_15795 [Ignavibacteriae bacterium]|nr:hypothetical protein [Ignavibacteriota bacterium]